MAAGKHAGALASPAGCATVWEEMPRSFVVTTGSRIALAAAAAIALSAQEPPPKPEPPPVKEVHVLETAQGLAPRLAPTDYQFQMHVGQITIGAEFAGHSVPTGEQTLTSEDFVVVEVGLYGPAGAHQQISLDDFSLRINGKKNVLHSLPYGRVLSSLKDPEWVPPESESGSKSKTSLGTGGNDRDAGSPPPVIHVPFPLQRNMAVHTQKASLPLGDRPLPQAGLLFFQYRGKTDNLDAVELMYEGPAGKATLSLLR